MDDAGNYQAVRLRGDAHKKGFWHRYVHVWVVDVPGERLMMQHRAATKKLFGDLWTCCTGHVSVGEPSLLHAQRAIESDFKRSYPERLFEFMFTCKEETDHLGLKLKQVIDVYALPLENPPSTSTLAVDSEEADAIKYVTLAELKDIYAQKDPGHVIISNPMYHQRFFYIMAKLIRRYVDNMPQEDSDDERHNQKAKQLLDTYSPEGDLSEPGPRGEVHRGGTWHRAAHVWLLDAAGGRALMIQRSKKKRHFRSQWTCSTAHIGAGESSRPAAIKSIKSDIGLTHIEDHEVELIFQAQNESDTGAGIVLKQVVDVYCVQLPSAGYLSAPPPEALTLAPGEVDQVSYCAIDELELIWDEGKAAHPNVVIPSSDEYKQRLLFYMRQKVRKFKQAAVGQGNGGQ